MRMSTLRYQVNFFFDMILIALLLDRAKHSTLRLHLAIMQSQMFYGEYSLKAKEEKQQDWPFQKCSRRGPYLSLYLHWSLQLYVFHFLSYYQY